MILRDFIRDNYAKAVGIQSEILSKPYGDAEIIAMIRSNTPKPELVLAWMQSYALFQGIHGADRDAIANTYLKFVYNNNENECNSDKDIRVLYAKLFNELYATLNRSWASATSKLLWCMLPNDIAIYDSFVLRSLLVLQHIEPCLFKFDKLREQPKNTDIQGIIDHYMLYQSMVKCLLATYRSEMDRLKAKNSNTYEYDIRLFDKLLWLLGNPRP